ncbi:MAG: class I SAM-dependent methyltransferase [Chloroflexi bacterium]|nr:class I SAM-dependent methyltransferase [Chloroflexota bacterium]
MNFVPCNLCGSTESRLRFPSTLSGHDRGQDGSAFRCTHAGYGVHHAIVECKQCGLVYANPRWSDDETLNHYEAVKDPLYLEEREGRVLTFQRHLRPLLALIGRLPKPGERLLDVGCYIGVFVEIARDAGWEATGVEPSGWGVAEARKRGLNVVEGTLASARFPDESFDVVTMWDVIEHLTDPMAELRETHRILRSPDPASGTPGGLLVIHTMDIESLFARLMGRRWPWLMEMHLYFFSRRTLKAMLEAAGFELIRAEAQGRYLRLGYVVTRIQPYSRPLAVMLGWLTDALGWRETAIPINLGDLFTAYARKKDE